MAFEKWSVGCWQKAKYLSPADGTLSGRRGWGGIVLHHHFIPKHLYQVDVLIKSATPFHDVADIKPIAIC
ncbi:MAG: hypothetical protein E2O44_05575 [Nitrospina sp.]|nr:MAG: hypothetical protein E2O44_05575 [Nitrospina sp.]